MPVSDRTLRICEVWRSRIGRGEKQARVVRDLAFEFGVGRPSIWKALRSGGAVAPYQPRQADGPGRPVGGGEPGYTAARIGKSADEEERQAERERPPKDVRLAPAEPCPRCNVRADVGCKHRPAEGTMPLAMEFTETPFDGRSRPNGGQGRSFHLPTHADAERLKEQLRGMR